MAMDPQRVVELRPLDRENRRPAMNGRRMQRPNAVGIAASGTALALTGLALAFFRYVVPSIDAFSAYPHPAWKYVLMAHVLATPVFFFFVGSLWWTHVVRYWRSRERRLSGGTVIALFGVVAASGYLLYFVGSEAGLNISRAIHTVAGIFGIVVSAGHAIVGWRVAVRRGRGPGGRARN